LIIFNIVLSVYTITIVDTTIWSMYTMYREEKRREMKDNIEDLIYEIIMNNDAEDSARVISSIMYDIESGNSIEYSIDKNCEIFFG